VVPHQPAAAPRAGPRRCCPQPPKSAPARPRPARAQDRDVVVVPQRTRRRSRGAAAAADPTPGSSAPAVPNCRKFCACVEAHSLRGTSAYRRLTRPCGPTGEACTSPLNSRESKGGSPRRRACNRGCASVGPLSRPLHPYDARGDAAAEPSCTARSCRCSGARGGDAGRLRLPVAVGRGAAVGMPRPAGRSRRVARASQRPRWTGPDRPLAPEQSHAVRDTLGPNCVIDALGPNCA